MILRQAAQRVAIYSINESSPDLAARVIAGNSQSTCASASTNKWTTRATNTAGHVTPATLGSYDHALPMIKLPKRG
ncbi:hypothetical protein NY667_21855 [Xanthomonas hortorum pv. hederae]|uniref:Uncharacterized protein n=1 Tax=Xanthomonas hortorum pv. hederae TaxID=453603 RepID=A0A9X4BVI8_9XANT|nr:hypothetical protein [Xanthomonas hortorum]MDC8640370.1 hypothetical protein [Xanthomonas hortorum pv. hederae]